jgi:hypothetical protein
MSRKLTFSIVLLAMVVTVFGGKHNNKNKNGKFHLTKTIDVLITQN